MSGRAERRFFARWLAACAVGEAVGLTASGTIAALVVPLVVGTEDEPSPALLRGIMIGAGALEGALLGTVQQIALARWLDAFSRGAWITASAIGMAVGWALGTLLTSDAPESPNIGTMVLYAVLTGAALGTVMGLAQHLTTPRSTMRRRDYVTASALGWALAMVVSFFGANALPPGEYGALSLAFGLVTGAAMGGVVALATGVVLVRAR